MTDSGRLEALLAGVSRSFFLTIKALPAGLREPIGLAYLLARAADTIADCAGVATETRAVQLRALAGMIAQEQTEPAALEQMREAIVPADPAERQLMAALDRCLALLAETNTADREEIKAVLSKITRGQELDVLRFPGAGSVRALQTAAELEEYTYLVAGCVGEFWTRLCFRHVRGCATRSEPEMSRLGRHFGQGLQLVNILRDLPADLRAGRCYLPADELAAAGCNDFTPPCPAVFQRWLERGRALLGDAFRYIEATRPARLRFACTLPWHLGLQTLSLLRRTPPWESVARVKVSRRQVRATMLLALPAACSNAALRRLAARDG